MKVTHPRTKPNVAIAAIVARRVARETAVKPVTASRASARAQSEAQPASPPRPSTPATASDPRSGLIAALTAAVRDASAGGDLAGARVALHALNGLLPEPAGASVAAVEIADRRRGQQ